MGSPVGTKDIRQAVKHGETPADCRCETSGKLVDVKKNFSVVYCELKKHYFCRKTFIIKKIL